MAGSLVTNYLIQGTAASRPASPTAATNTLTFYFATDTETLSFYDWNDAAWQDVATSGGLVAATTTEQLTGTSTTVASTPDSVAALWEQGSDVASAATISLGEGGHFNITGTTDITDIDFGTDKAGRLATLVFAGALTVTHGANLISYTGASLRTAAGTVMIVRSEGTDVVRILWSNGTNVNNLNTYYPVFTRPVDGDYAWINQGGASVTTNANGGLYLLAPAGAGTNVRLRKKAAPATPYTITAALLFDTILSVDFPTAGIGWRQSSDGKLILFHSIKSGTTGNNELRCSDYTSATAFSATNLGVDMYQSPGLLWLRITDDGANRVTAFSVDGYNFTTHFSEGRTVFLTADEVGFFAESNNATWPGACTLLSWKET